MQYIIIALISALLFGASTPIGKILLESLPPFQLAGLLYLGAALGVLPFSLKSDTSLKLQNMDRRNLSYLVGAIILGGAVGPVLLLFGLQMAPAASVAMWLNLELAATAILGYLLFKDYIGSFGWIGVAGTRLASVLLSWNEGGIGPYALVLVGSASICWGIDNHLTALIDNITPTQSTFWKGLVAGLINLLIGISFEPFNANVWLLVGAMVVGVFSYGFSISLYIFAAQNLGATRSQMIFASAPFFGVILSVLLLGEKLSTLQITAALLLCVSLITLFRDRHAHYHVHEPLHHTHNHRHDDDHHLHEHRHEIAPGYHTHWHDHKSGAHSHPHWPDVHHRHKHQNSQ